MLKPDILIIATLLSLMGAVSASFGGWQTKKDMLLTVARYLTGLSAILLFGALLWLALLRQHPPATTLDEAWLSLSLLIIVLYFLFFNAQPFNIVVWAGLTLNIFCLAWGTYLLVSTPPHLGLEPAWILTGIGRWLILIALASFYWLAIIAFLTLLESFLKKSNFQADLRQVQNSKEKLRRYTIFFWLSGSCILFASYLLRAGNSFPLLINLVIPLLLFSAALWLRFARTRRIWSESILLIIAFLSALPVLSAISF